jgi:hypothetical protein
MSSIIHDWPNRKATGFLKNTISALGPDPMILFIFIDDKSFPNSGVHWYETGIDITMMAGLASQESTVEQWNDLMEKAGLKIHNTYAYTGTYNSIMECVPVSQEEGPRGR